MGGMVALIGDADRAPVRITVPQAWLHAAAESAVAALVGHLRRLQTGEAQFVDVSVQAGVFWTGLNAMIAPAIQGKDIERTGTLLQLGVLDLPLVQHASDGEVVVVPTGRRWPASSLDGGRRRRHARVESAEDWTTYDVRVLTGQADALHGRRGDRGHRAFTARRTQGGPLRLGPRTRRHDRAGHHVADVLAFDHLQARGYWHGYNCRRTRCQHPGPFVRPATTPVASAAPPRPGEHSAEVVSEWRTAPAAPLLWRARRQPARCRSPA